MRAIPRTPGTVFAILLALLQYPLWLGHGGFLRVHQLERELSTQREHNALQKQHNLALEAEVHDLRAGSEAIEERARADLGMVREGETWFRYSGGGNHRAIAPSQR